MTASLGRWAAHWSTLIRRFLASIFIIIGVLAGTIAAITWTAREVLYDQDRFVEAFDSLTAEESLRERVAEGITEKLMIVSDLAIEGRLDQFGSLEDLGIEAEDVDESDTESFAEAIRAEQESIISEAATAVVNDADFADIFVNAVRESHDDLLDALEDDSELITSSTGEVFINLNRLFPAVQAEIADQPITQPLALVDLPSAVGQFKVLDKTVGFNWMWDLLRNAEEWTDRLIILSIGGLVAAVLVSDRRPWAIITWGTGIASIAVVIVVIGYVIWALVPLLVDISETSGLVATVYRKAIGPLVRTEILVAAAGIGVALVGSLARWIWPDDWVYEHHDDGRGPMAVQVPYATQQMFPQYPQQYQPQAYPPQYQQPMPQQLPQYQPQYQQLPQAPVFRPSADTPEPFSGGSTPTAALPAAAPAPAADPGPPTEAAPAVDAEGWDYDSGEW